jgi:HPt (histidine-containing phosphotransfer) domain-containing protein
MVGDAWSLRLAAGFGAALARPWKTLYTRCMKSSANPPPAESETGDLDPAILEALGGLSLPGDPGFLGELVESYGADSRRLLTQLKGAIAARDEAQFRRLAHELKGSSAAVGAIRLSQLCESLESAIGDEAWPLRAEACDRAEALHQAAAARLRERAAHHRASPLVD